MRVGFAGTPPFAATVLEALLDAGFAIPIVLTQPDRPKGRGLRSQASPVKAIAAQRGLRVVEPTALKPVETLSDLLAIPLDVLAVAAYGLILPSAMLAWPRHGAINVHASLLPRWRGAAPVQRAIQAGDSETGVTIMQIDAGLDTGPILDMVRIPIGERDTASRIASELARVGAAALIRVLRDLEAGRARPPTAQPAAGATYAPKVEKQEAALDWSRSAPEIDRAIRAFDPAPGAWTTLDGEIVKLWRAEPVAVPVTEIAPGTLIDVSTHELVVACGEGALRVTELQPAGSRRMGAAAFVAGRRNLRGMRFGTPRA